MAKRLRIRTHAKVNLYLEILGRRSDGYHDIDTVMQTVALSDEMELEEQASGSEVVCEAPGVPLNERRRGPRRIVRNVRRAG